MSREKSRKETFQKTKREEKCCAGAACITGGIPINETENSSAKKSISPKHTPTGKGVDTTTRG
jgi:hypothetical protein